MTNCIRLSLIMKFVAHVSSSINNNFDSRDIYSIIFADCEVLPDASSVEKLLVVLFYGKLFINGDILTLLIYLPSSDFILIAELFVITYSRPSPGIWL